MNVKFSSIHRKSSLAREIADAIYDAIMFGKLAPGTKLPGQRVLAQQFGASTTTVREALSMLAAMDLVEIHHGQGTIVRDKTVAANFRGWLGATLSREETEDFIEARYLIEAFTLEKVIRNISPEQLEKLERACEEMEKALDNPELYPEKDIAFHRMLVEAAGNKVLAEMADVIYSQLRSQISRSMVHQLKTDNLRESCERHRDLLQHIRDKNIPAALGMAKGLLLFARKTP